MDAFSCALPVISTDHAGIPEIVEDKVSGYLVAERSSEDIMSALMDYAQLNSRDRLAMKKKARETVEFKYNSRAYFEEYSQSICSRLNFS